MSDYSIPDYGIPYDDYPQMWGPYQGIQRSTEPMFSSMIPTTDAYVPGYFVRAINEETASLVLDMPGREERDLVRDGRGALGCMPIQTNVNMGAPLLWFLNIKYIQGKQWINWNKGEYIDGVWEEIDPDLLVDEGL